MFVFYEMSLFQLLDQYTLCEILNWAKSYNLTYYLYSLIEDRSLLRDLDAIDSTKNLLTEFMNLGNNKAIPPLSQHRVNDLTIIAVKRQFVDLLDKIRAISNTTIIVIKYGTPALVQYYIDEYKVNVDYTMGLSIHERRVDLVKWFIKRGVYIQYHFIFNAIGSNNSSILKSILDNYEGSNLNNPAIYSISMGRLDMLIEILDRRDSFDVNSLIESSMLNNRLEITKYLIERFEVVDSNHWFEYAVFCCPFEYADYFIEREADNLEEVIERAEAMDIDYIDSILEYLYGLR